MKIKTDILHLKPCPFCGKMPELTTKAWRGGAWGYERHRVGQLECEPCGLKMRADSQNLSSSVQEVVEQWNQRSKCRKIRKVILNV